MRIVRNIITLIGCLMAFLVLAVALWNLQADQTRGREEQDIYNLLQETKKESDQKENSEQEENKATQKPQEQAGQGVFNGLIQEIKETIQTDETNNPAKESSNISFSNSKEVSSAVEEPASYSYRFRDFANPDLFGWITIEGTAVNYPVMYTPQDPEYYLHRNFFGEYSPSGVPFVAASCFPGCLNTIIYGHHMRDGTMFKTLTDYSERSFYEAHPMINFETAEGSGVYEVMAAFYTQIYPATENGVFKYYEYPDLRDPNRYESYIGQIKSLSLYETGVEARSGEELLTLSTCSYHIPEDGRFVVVAKRI